MSIIDNILVYGNGNIYFDIKNKLFKIDYYQYKFT